jgi:hypothetical protein
MLSFDNLLETYTKLRKRTYSLTESLIVEQELKANTNYNKFFPAGTTLGQLQALYNSPPKPPTGVSQTTLDVGNYPDMGVQYEKNGVIYFHFDGKNVAHMPVNVFDQELQARMQQKEEGGEGGEGEDDQMQQPLTVEDIMPRDVQAKNQGVLSTVAKLLGLDPLAASESLSNLDRALFDLKQGKGTQFHAVAAGLGTQDGGEAIAQEAIGEFNADLNNVLEVARDHLTSKNECLDMEPLTAGQKASLARFCIRGGGVEQEVRYGNFSNPASVAPLLDQQTDEFFHGKGDSARRARTYGPKVCGANLRGVENPIFHAVKNLAKTPQCADSTKRAIASTGAADRAGGFTAVRGKWGEQASIIAALIQECGPVPRGPHCEQMLVDLEPLMGKLVGQMSHYTAQVQVVLQRIYGPDMEYDVFATEEMASLQKLFGPVFEAKEVGGDPRRAAEVLLFTLLKQEIASNQAMAVDGDIPRAALRDPKTGKAFADDTGYTKGEDGVWREEKRDTVYCYNNPGSAETFLRRQAERDGVELSERSLQRARNTNCVGISDKTVEVGWQGEVAMGNKGIMSEFGTPQAREISRQVTLDHAEDLAAAGVSEEDVQGFRDMHARREEFFDSTMAALTSPNKTGEELTQGAGESKKRPSGPQSPQDIESDLEEKIKMYPRGSTMYKRLKAAIEDVKDLNKMDDDSDPTEKSRQVQQCLARLENVWVLEQTEGSKYPEDTKGDPDFVKHWTTNRIMVGKASDDTPVKTRELGGATRTCSSGKGTTKVVRGIYAGEHELDYEDNLNGVKVVSVGQVAQRYKTSRSAGFWDVDGEYLYPEMRGGDVSFDPGTATAQIQKNHKQVLSALDTLIQEVKILKGQYVGQ